MNLQPVHTNTFPNISWCHVEITNPCTFVASSRPKYMFFGSVTASRGLIGGTEHFLPHHVKGRAGRGQENSRKDLDLLAFSLTHAGVYEECRHILVVIRTQSMKRDCQISLL